MSEAQLENLRKARSKSAERRRLNKEAKDMEKATAKLERDQKKQAKIDKQMEADAMLEMKAKMKLQALNDAQREATWDEERLTKLIEKTLDNYIDKRRKEKAPTSRQTLVAPQPHTQTQQPIYQQPLQPQQPVYFQQQQPQRYQQRTNGGSAGYDDNPFARFM